MVGFLRRLLRRDYWWAEFWSAVPSIGWAVIGAAAERVTPTPPTFGVLVQISPAWTWNALLVAGGLFQLGALALDDRWARVVAAALMSWAWGSIALSVIDAVPHTRAIALYGGLIGINLVALARQLSHALDTMLPRGCNHGGR